MLVLLLPQYTFALVLSYRAWEGCEVSVAQQCIHAGCQSPAAAAAACAASSRIVTVPPSPSTAITSPDWIRCVPFPTPERVDGCVAG